MKTLIFQIPDPLDEGETKSLLASALYEKGWLSLGQAAKLIGFSKRAFMEILGNYGVSIFEYSEAELEKDILSAQNYHR